MSKRAFMFSKLLKSGQTAAIFPPPLGVESEASPPATVAVPDSTDTGLAPYRAPLGQPTPALFPELAKTALAHGVQEKATALVNAFKLDAQAHYDYPLKVQALPPLMSEVLPSHPDDFEAQLVSFIDFSAVLADRDRSRTKLIQRTVDIFGEAADTPQDVEVWAKMSVAQIAHKARQIAFEYPDVDRREFLHALRQRFRNALEVGGFELPASEEDLTQQLELVLVRNPKLIQQANKRCRASQIQLQAISLPTLYQSPYRLEAAKRNLYGVFPLELSPDERRLAELLDIAPEVLWWHRNPVRQPESVALYRWSSGIGFFPDFVVAVQGRKTGDGIALVEFKGRHLQQYDKAKAGAVHLHYGRAFMVGQGQQDKNELRLWRLAAEDELVDDGLFEVGRLRYD